MDDQNIKRRRLGAVSPGFFAGLALAFDFSGSARRRVLVVSADEMLRTAWGDTFWHMQQSYQTATNDIKTSSARD